MYRVIYSLRLRYDFNRKGGCTEVLVHLDRNGNDRRKGGVRPRHKRRVVDLRTGDDFFVLGCWKRLEQIRMEFELVISDEEAAAFSGDRGWLVKAPEGYVTPLTGGSKRRDEP